MKIISVRVPEEWKTSMDAARTNWSEFVRSAIRWKLDQLDRKRTLGRLQKMAPPRKRPASGSGAKSVREDRDAG